VDHSVTFAISMSSLSVIVKRLSELPGKRHWDLRQPTFEGIIIISRHGFLEKCTQENRSHNGVRDDCKYVNKILTFLAFSTV
jgi:hypothetical protein